MWTSGTQLAVTVLWMAAKSSCASYCPAGWNKLSQPMDDAEFRQAPQYVVNSAFPQFVQQPAGGTYIEGTRVSLSCALDVSVPGLQLVWAVNDTGIVECPVKSNCVFNNSETASTLQILSFSASMEGTYQCIAKNGNYTVTSSTARIIRPTFFGWIDPFPQDPIRKAQNGSTVVIVCDPNATAAVVWITWGIGGNYNKSNTNSVALVNYSDPGYAGAQQVVSCTVTFGNNLQAQTRKFILEPSPEQLPSTFLQFKVMPANVTVPTGGKVVLFCIAEGNPWPTILWYKDGVLQTAHENVLSLTNATLEMSGAYTCVASNGGPNDISSTATVRVQAPPGVAAIRTVSEYDQNGSDIFLPLSTTDPQLPLATLQLECEAQFSTADAADFRWFFRGRPAITAAPSVVETSNRLVMSASDVSELVGSVQCLVITAAGTSFANARLLISGKPNYPQLYTHSRSYFQYSFSWAPPTPAAIVPPIISYVVQVLAWQQDFMVCEREAFGTSTDLDAILFEDETIRTRVAAKSKSGVLSDFVPDTSGISVLRVQPPPPLNLQSNTSESGWGYQVSLGWTLPPSSVYPSTSYSVGMDLECSGSTPLQVEMKDLKRDSSMVYTMMNISCCSNCSWSVRLVPITTQPVISTASSAFQTGSIAMLSPLTLNSLQWHGINGTSISISVTLPMPAVLCHCSGPLVIDVSYSNETSLFYTSFVLSEYQSDTTSYSHTLVLENAECWRQYNVSVAYRSSVGGASFSHAIILNNSELIDLLVMEGVAVGSSSVAVQLKPPEAVDCILRTKLGTFQLSYYQPAITNQSSGQQANLSSQYLVLDGLIGNASVLVMLNVTIGKRTRLVSLVLQLEPSTATMTSSTSDLEVTSLAEKGMIVGIVTGVCVIVAVVVVGVILFVCIYLARRYLKSRSRQQRDEEVQIITQALMQPQQQPEATNLVDTECHSIASTEATHLDRMAAYIRDVDTYGKGAPDGDADNSMMEDPPVPRCDDLQSVADDKDVGVRLNRSGSVLSSQHCDAMELESLTPEPNDDYIALHSRTETRHLLEVSPPVPRTNAKLKTSRTKALGVKGIKPTGEGSKAKEEIQGSSLKSSRRGDMVLEHPQAGRTRQEDTEPSQKDVGGSNTQDPDQQLFINDSLSSDEHILPNGCSQRLYSEGGHPRGVSQGYVTNPSLPYNLPGTDILNSVTGMGHDRPVNASASVDYNRPQLAMNSQQYVKGMHRTPPHDKLHPQATCHRDAFPDGGVASQLRIGDYSDRHAMALRDRMVNPHDFDSAMSPRGPCYGCNSSSSSSSSHRCHVDDHLAIPRYPLTEYLPSQPQHGGMVVSQGSYPSGSSIPGHHSTLSYRDTRGYVTPRCYGAGIPHNTTGCLGSLYHHHGAPEMADPHGFAGRHPWSAVGCQGGNQCNCSRQHQPWHDSENASHQNRTYASASRVTHSSSMMAPNNCVESACDQRNGDCPPPGLPHVTNYRMQSPAHMMSHSGHMTSHGCATMFHNNLVPPDSISCNQLWSHQANVSSHLSSGSHADIPFAIRHQSEIATPPGPSHPVQQPQQAEDLNHVAVFIPKSPKNPYPMAPSPLPPSAHPATQFPPPQTAQVNNRDKFDGYVDGAAVSNPNANHHHTMPNFLTDCEGDGIKNVTESNYITLPSSSHGDTILCAHRDVGPSEHIEPISSESAYTRTRCLYQCEAKDISPCLPPIDNSSSRPTHSSVSTTQQPCIPSLLRQTNS